MSKDISEIKPEIKASNGVLDGVIRACNSMSQAGFDAAASASERLGNLRNDREELLELTALMRRIYINPSKFIESDEGKEDEFMIPQSDPFTKFLEKKNKTLSDIPEIKEMIDSFGGAVRRVKGREEELESKIVHLEKKLQNMRNSSRGKEDVQNQLAEARKSLDTLYSFASKTQDNALRDIAKKTMYKTMYKNFKEIVKTDINIVKELTKVVGGNIKHKAGQAMGEVAKAIKTFVEAVKKFCDLVVNTVKDIIKSVKKFSVDLGRHVKYKAGQVKEWINNKTAGKGNETALQGLQKSLNDLNKSTYEFSKSLLEKAKSCSKISPDVANTLNWLSDTVADKVTEIKQVIGDVTKGFADKIINQKVAGNTTGFQRS